jgi:hypothetical protein
VNHIVIDEVPHTTERQRRLLLQAARLALVSVQVFVHQKYIFRLAWTATGRFVVVMLLVYSTAFT